MHICYGYAYFLQFLLWENTLSKEGKIALHDQEKDGYARIMVESTYTFVCKFGAVLLHGEKTVN